MADILGFDVPIDLPTVGFGLGSTFWFMIMFVIFVFILLGVGIFFIHRFKVYRYKIIVFENISGQGYQPNLKDRARLVRLGDGGEEILYLLKKKVYRSAYGKKMGKNTYWFAIGQDGYWYNIVLGDVDAKMGMLDIEPIDRDMRYMHVAIRKNIQDRYRKTSPFEKYAPYVFNGIFIIIMIIGIWFLLDKIADISTASAESVKVAVDVQKETKSIISSLDNICTGGSGLRSGG